ncbi:MAG: cytochrome P460 family protein [Thiomicrorhabdus sp.]|nr:cytochrome P460 family protein [Thiomicrorhabdus sp.]
MKRIALRASLLAVLGSTTAFSMSELPKSDDIVVPKAVANGIEFPVNYQAWDTVSVSYREDNQTLRAIIGNSLAIKAIADGQTNPWPDGVVLGKMVWKAKQDAHWKAAKVPDKFIHAEFMFKDSNKWADTKGWGWARWVGLEQVPFGKDAESAHASCIACHAPVSGQDWVFTKPAVMPKRIQ